MHVPIEAFQGDYRFLSNFWPSPWESEIGYAPTVEHYYQANKFCTEALQQKVLAAKTAAEAKYLPKLFMCREDWPQVKLGIMEKGLRAKFLYHLDLREKLLATGSAKLIEGNTWGDRFWGECPMGAGSNHLGKLLMKIRAEYQNMNTLQEFF